MSLPNTAPQALHHACGSIGLSISGATMPRSPPNPAAPPLAKPVDEIPGGKLRTLQRKARDCRACPLWRPATQTVFGNRFRVTRERGQWRDLRGDVQGIASWHPSAVLRMPGDRREQGYAELVEDLGKVAKLIKTLA